MLLSIQPGEWRVPVKLRRRLEGQWQEGFLAGTGNEQRCHEVKIDRSALHGGYTRLEPRVRVRPLGGEPQLVLYHHPYGLDGREIATHPAILRVSDPVCRTPTERRREMNVAAIPLLYVFEADEAAWLELESHLAELREWWRDDRTEGGRIIDLYKTLYNIFNSMWRDLRYPIDSAGRPPLGTRSRPRQGQGDRTRASPSGERCQGRDGRTLRGSPGRSTHG